MSLQGFEKRDVSLGLTLPGPCVTVCELCTTAVTVIRGADRSSVSDGHSCDQSSLADKLQILAKQNTTKYYYFSYGPKSLQILSSNLGLLNITVLVTLTPPELVVRITVVRHSQAVQWHYGHDTDGRLLPGTVWASLAVLPLPACDRHDILP